jgi:hypothetical protein
MRVIFVAGLSLGCLAAGIAAAMPANTSGFIGFVIALTLGGFALSFVDLACNGITALWEDADAWLNLLHFGFGVGAVRSHDRMRTGAAGGCAHGRNRSSFHHGAPR